MKTILKTRQNGFAIIEALIAFLLLGIGVAALIYLQGNLMVGSSTSKARAEAMEIAKDRAEVLRNHIDKGQYLSALGSVSDESVTGVNATYTVSYTVLQKDDGGDLLVIDDTDNPPTIAKTQNLTVKVSWTGSEENSEEAALETMLYFMSPTIASNLGSDGGGEESVRPPLVGPWISGEEGEDPSTAPIKLVDDNPSDNDIATADDGLLGIEINRYFATTGTLTGRSNVEVLYDTDGDGVKEVVLTSFGGIVHRIKGKIITDRFSVPLDSDGDGVLNQDELRNFWIDDGGVDVDDDGIVDGIANDGYMQDKEVKYWIDGSSGVTERLDDDGNVNSVEPDGIIQNDEYTFWDDANGSGNEEVGDVVDVSEFDPPEATAKALSTIEDLRVLGSPPSFCVFPICDDPFDTDNDCKVPVDPNHLPDDTKTNSSVDAFGIASYVCYVPGDCTYQDIYSKDTDDNVVLNGCPVGFIQPTDDDFDDLNGGWYGRVGNFGIKLNPDDMVCTADTTKTHLTPSREYVTYRCKVDLVDGTCPDDDADESNGNANIIANEGINTPYSNQTFIIARKNNKPSVYCPIRALSYEGNLVNEQIKRELSGPKKFNTDGSPDDTTAWDKNIVLPENICTTGLSCP